MIIFFRKYHKWLGVIFALIILSYVFSGIVLNHRLALSFVDINRNLLPKEYRYQNWNNAAVKSTLKISSDSILIYGNIGIWLTDSSFTDFKNFSAGVPKGIDNRKIFQMIRTTGYKLLAVLLKGFLNGTHKQGKFSITLKNSNIYPLHATADLLVNF